MEQKELSPRKQKILKAIVDLYIRTAEPVGSKTIAQLTDMDFSSATIRNEMAELTNLGYLEQPHTSAGRIPSPMGYRFYIDRLMQDYRLTTDEAQSINQAMELRMQEFDRYESGRQADLQADKPSCLHHDRPHRRHCSETVRDPPC